MKYSSLTSPDDNSNPLETIFADLRSAEDAILRDARYRDELDQLALEFGPEAFLWDSFLREA